MISMRPVGASARRLGQRASVEGSRRLQRSVSRAGTLAHRQKAHVRCNERLRTLGERVVEVARRFGISRVDQFVDVAAASDALARTRLSPSAVWPWVSTSAVPAAARIRRAARSGQRDGLRQSRNPAPLQVVIDNRSEVAVRLVRRYRSIPSLGPCRGRSGLAFR